MRKFTCAVLASTFLAASLGFAAQATEQTYEVEYTNETPLMVIRFNQRHVMYQKPLYNTISQALATKPSATFDVICVAPIAKGGASQLQYNQISSQNNNRVIDTLQQIGLPKSRINVTQVTDNVDASEVRIFVH